MTLVDAPGNLKQQDTHNCTPAVPPQLYHRRLKARLPAPHTAATEVCRKTLGSCLAAASAPSMRPRAVSAIARLSHKEVLSGRRSSALL